MLSCVPDEASRTRARRARPARGSRRVVVRGFIVLARGAAERRWEFTLAVLGSALWAFMTVAQAYVLGRITSHTVIPAFQSGHVVAGGLWSAALLVLTVAPL